MSIYLVPTSGGVPQLQHVQIVDKSLVSAKGRTKCPFHNGKSDTTFSISMDKGCYKCFNPSCNHGIGLALYHNQYYEMVKKNEAFLNRDNEKPITGIEEWQVIGSDIVWDEPVKEEPIWDEIIREHIYKDENGLPIHKTIYYKTTTGGKTPRQHRYINENWMPGLDGVNKLPYNLSNLLKEDDILYVEGEKDCDTLLELGIENVTTLGSANSKLEQHQHKYFRNKNIIIIPDNDLAGYQFVRLIGKQLYHLAKSVRVCFLPSEKDNDKSDITDYLNLDNKKRYNLLLNFPIEKRKDTFFNFINEHSINFNQAKKLFKYDLEEETELVSFDEIVNRFKDFPIGIFPKNLQIYARSVAETMSVPVEWVMGTIFSVTSSLLGNKVNLDCGFGNHIARPSFSFILVCPNGSNKTHPMQKVLSYIYVKHAHQKELYKTALKEYQNAIQQGKKDKSIYLPEKPIRRRYYINDTTFEQLSKALDDNPQGLLWTMNEIAGLFGGLNQYKHKGNDEQNLICVMDGVNFDVIRGEYEASADKPFVSILGTTQPQIIRQIMNKYKDNGLAYRFCYCYIGHNFYKVKPNTPDNINSILNTFYSKLDNLPLNFEPYVLTFEEDAFNQAISYINNDISDLEHAYKDDSIIRGIISKIRTQFINNCCLLHCMHNATNDNDLEDNLKVNLATVHNAYRLAMYYMYHAYITLYIDSTNPNCDYEINKLKKYADKNGLLNIRKLQQNVFKNKKADEIKTILDEYEKQGKGYYKDKYNFNLTA